MAFAQLYTILLLLTSAVEVTKTAGTLTRDECVLHPPCLDLLTVERITQHVSRNVSSTDRENILLKCQTFDKIRKKKYLHSCVLEKIISLFEDVLKYTWHHSNDHKIINSQLELISVMERVRDCTYKVKRCAKLYRKASKKSNSEMSEADMTPEGVAIFQLQKLNHANERLNDPSILEGVMDELKSLHHYLPGNGFRKTNG